MASCCFVAALVAVGVATLAIARGLPRDSVALVPVVFAAALGIGVLWGLRLPRTPEPVECGEDALSFPVLSRRRLRRRGYASIGLVWRGRRTGDLFVWFRGALFPAQFSDRHFAARGAIAELETAVLTRVEASPAGDVVRKRRRLMPGWPSVPWLTGSVSLLLVGAFLLELRQGALENGIEMLRLGGTSPWLVAQGEWFRLASGPLLHVGPAHLLRNVGALLLWAALLEGRLGRWRCAALLLASMLAGSAAMALLRDSFAVIGASAAVYALFGAHVTLIVRFRRELPEGAALGILVLCYALFVPIAVLEALWMGASIGWEAHATGLLVGIVLTLALTRGMDVEHPTVSRGLRWSVLGLVAVFVLALGEAGRSAWSFDLDDHLARLEQHAMSRLEGAERVYANGLAWELLEQGASSDQLRVARAVLERGVALEAERWVELDTLAALQLRTGDIERAFHTQRFSVRYAQPRSLGRYMSRLAWIEWARLGCKTRWPRGSLDPVVEVIPDGASSGQPNGLRLHVPGTQPQGISIHALAFERDELRGILVAQLGPHAGGTHELRPIRWQGSSAAPVRFEVSFVGPPLGAPDAQLWWHYSTLDRAALAVLGADPCGAVR